MREIKFRGKSLKTQEWLYGSHFTDSGEDYIIPQNLLGINDYEEYQADQNTVGQFTGLRDINDKEIFEGDILESNSIRHVVKYLEKGALFAGVSTVIKDAMTGDYAETPLFQHWIDGWKKEVIGNIHDNPELIGK